MLIYTAPEINGGGFEPAVVGEAGNPHGPTETLRK